MEQNVILRQVIPAQHQMELTYCSALIASLQITKHAIKILDLYATIQICSIGAIFSTAQTTVTLKMGWNAIISLHSIAWLLTEFIAQHCKSQTKKELTAGQTMGKTVQAQEFQTVTLQKVKFVQRQMFHSASQRTIKPAFKIWVTIAITRMTTQVVTSIKIYQTSVRQKILTTA